MTRLNDTLDHDEADREFTVRVLQALIDQFDRMVAVAGKNIRFDVPLHEQFDAETLTALAQAVTDNEELQDLLAAMNKEAAS